MCAAGSYTLHCVLDSAVGMPWLYVHYLKAHYFVRHWAREVLTVLNSISNAAAADMFSNSVHHTLYVAVTCSISLGTAAVRIVRNFKLMPEMKAPCRSAKQQSYELVNATLVTSRAWQILPCQGLDWLHIDGGVKPESWLVCLSG